MKETAEAYLGETVTEAVITVPAYFNDSQRQATKDAGKIAGLEVLRIINEPTAAALAYGLEKKGAGTIAVYDLGGGTFDISVLEIGDGVFEVKSTNGDTFLGGEDFDKRVIDYLADEFKKEQGIDLRSDRLALQRLKEAAEKAKIELSSSMQTEVNLPFITADQHGPKHLNIKLTRAKLEALVDDLIQRTIEPCRNALEGRRTEGVGDQRGHPGRRHDPHAQGDRDGEAVLRPRAEPLGQSRRGGGGRRGDPGRRAEGRGEGRPAARRDAAVARHRDPGRRVHPAHRPQHHDPDQEEPDLLDRRGQPDRGHDPRLPGRARDGGRQQAAGPVRSVGLPPAPRGMPQVEVTFDIDANGIVSVSAKDKATGKEQQIRIQASGGLNEADIDKMVKDAEAHAEEDKKRRELVEARNHAEALVHTTERTLKENGDKIPASDREAVEAAIRDLKAASGGEDVGQIRAKTEALAQVSMKIGEAMYKAQQSGGAGGGGAAPGGDAGGAGPGASGGGAGSEKVVDADFEEVDERKKRSG